MVSNLYQHKPEDFYFEDEPTGDNLSLAETIYWKRKAEKLEGFVKHPVSKGKIMVKTFYNRFGENPDPKQENLERGLAETIYWKRKAEKLEGLVKHPVSKKIVKRKGSKTGISVRLTPRDAKEVYDNFSFRKEYLKSLIDEYVPKNTRKSVDEMTYTELKRYGHVIRGVAKKEIKK